MILPSAIAAIQTCITNHEVIPGKHLKTFLQSTYSQREQGDDQITFQGVSMTDVPDIDLDKLSSLLSSLMSTVHGMQAGLKKIMI